MKMNGTFIFTEIKIFFLKNIEKLCGNYINQLSEQHEHEVTCAC